MGMAQPPSRILSLFIGALSGATLLGAAACTGKIRGSQNEDPAVSGADHDPPDGTTSPGSTPSPRAGAGLAPLRRMTQTEYDHTIRDLTGYTGQPSSAFPADLRGASGFSEPSKISIVEASRLMEAAEQVASFTVGRLDQIHPCDPARPESACA